MRLNQVYEKFRDRADFWWIYTREAHASDSSRPSRKVKIEQHKSFEDRRKAAASCTKNIKLEIPMLVDDMKDTVTDAYAG